jgi:hypothetical protein
VATLVQAAAVELLEIQPDKFFFRIGSLTKPQWRTQGK